MEGCVRCAVAWGRELWFPGVHAAFVGKDHYILGGWAREPRPRSYIRFVQLVGPKPPLTIIGRGVRLVG